MVELEVVPLNAEEEAVLRAFARVLRVLPRRLDADLAREQGMSQAEYSVLMHLSEAEGRRLRLTDLASACAQSLSTISRAVDRLSAAGLVARQSTDRDAREVWAQLTDAGLTRLQEAWPTHLASVRRHLFDQLDGVDLCALARALTRVAESGECRP
jgi:DNA-binding MarR family transcriptional regulator